MKSPRMGTVASIAIGAVGMLLLAGCGSSAGSNVESVDIEGVGTITPSVDLEALVPDALARTGLRVVTSAPYAPFEMFGEGNKLEGVDIDLAQAIGAKLGVATNTASVDFSGLIPAIKAKKYDIAMAGIGDTVDRQEVFNFVDYAQSGSAFVLAADNPERVTRFLDLCGLNVATELGSTFDRVIENRQSLCEDAGKPAVSMTQYPTQAASLLAMQSGAVSALATTKTTASLIASEQPGKFTALQDPDAPAGYPTMPGGPMPYTGIAVPKDDQQLFDAIFAAMEELGEDGITQKIFDKWGIGDVAAIPPLQNQGGE